MSNKLNGLNPFLYEKILRIIPNLHTFLTKNNIVFEYVLCLNHYNRANRSVVPFNYLAIKSNPESVITLSFEWADGNNMLESKNIQPVNWSILYSEFYSNYHLYSRTTFSNIKII